MAREIIPSQYMEGDRAEESRGQKGKSYRHSGTFAKGLRGIPLPRSLSFSSASAWPEAAATDPETPDGVARRSPSPPSAPQPPPGLPMPPLPSRRRRPLRAGTWKPVADEEEQEAATAKGGSACLRHGESQRETHAVTRRAPTNSTSNGHIAGGTPL